MSQNIAQSVSQNVTVMAGARMITYLASFALMLFLPRYLGPEDYGRLYLGISITGIFSIIINFGGNYSISKAVSRMPGSASQIVVDAIGFRLLFWLLSAAALIIFSFVMGYSTTIKVILLILGIGMLWENIRGVLWSFFQGIERMEFPSYGATLYGIFLAIAGIIALLNGANSVVIALIMMVSEILYLLVCVKFARRFIADIPAFDWKATVALVKEGIPYFFQSIFGVIYYRIDTVMLSLMTPATVVGWYGASYKFFDTLMFVPNIYSIAIFPVLARLWKSENKSMANLSQKSLDYILIIGIPISIGTFAFAHQIIQYIFGMAGYANSIVLLQIFALGMLLLYIDWVIGTSLLASDRQRQLSVNAFIAIFVNIALNYLLIPVFQARTGNGGIGSAIATLITEFYIMCGMLYIMPKNVFEDSAIAFQVKGLGAGVVMAVALWLMHIAHVPWIAAAAASMVVYGAGILSFRVFDRDELAFIRKTLDPRTVKSMIFAKKSRTP